MTPPKSTKREIALGIAREFFPDLSDDDLTTLLWRHTDYPDWLGDSPETELRRQLEAYKAKMGVSKLFDPTPLNEVQTQHATIVAMQARIDELEADNAHLKSLLQLIVMVSTEPRISLKDCADIVLRVAKNNTRAIKEAHDKLIEIEMRGTE